jgi:hypothetical protein
VRGITRSLARLRAEAAKCVLLCANCHAEVEAEGIELPLELKPAQASGSTSEECTKQTERSGVADW